MSDMENWKIKNFLKYKDDINFILFLIIIGLGIGYITYDSSKKNEELEKFKQKTVGKINRIDTKGKGVSSFVYSFFIDNKMYVGRIDRDKNPYIKINDFYEIEYSAKNPHINKIILDEEITDSVKIMNAGYQKRTKFYKYDNFGNFLKEIDTLYFER
jgi:hypothetical protein